MGISRPLAAALVLLLIAVAGVAAEEPVAVEADSVAGAVEATARARAEEAKEAAALRAELDQLRAKISTLGQWLAKRFKITGGARFSFVRGVIWLEFNAS